MPCQVIKKMSEPQLCRETQEIGENVRFGSCSPTAMLGVGVCTDFVSFVASVSELICPTLEQAHAVSRLASRRLSG